MIQAVRTKLAEIQNLDPEWAELHVFGPTPDDLIDAAESLLDVRFPPDYREFLRAFGGIFGIANGVLDPPDLHNCGCVVHETTIARARFDVHDKSFVLRYDPEEGLCVVSQDSKVFVHYLAEGQTQLDSTDVHFNSCAEYILSELSTILDDME